MKLFNFLIQEIIIIIITGIIHVVTFIIFIVMIYFVGYAVLLPSHVNLQRFTILKERANHGYDLLKQSFF